ncbi:MAG: FAD/NAD(P)-binding protein [Halorubrum sp.]
MNDGYSDDAPDVVIVGGGIHGTHIAQRLLEDTELGREGLAIYDPNDRLLASFRRKAAACGTESLRSTYVQHVGTEPFGLESFAESRGREDELRPTVDYPDRPSLALFLDYSDHLIETNGLGSLHRQSTVERIERRDEGGFRLTTSTGSIDTSACVLAIGYGGRYRVPGWGSGVDDVTHVWDGFDPDTTADHTVVVGGGITAVQLACTLSEHEPVTMVSRHPLEWEVAEADPPWLNWNHVERELHCHSRASADRLEVVRAARYSASVPPHLYDALDARIDAGRLRLVEGHVADVSAAGDGTAIELEDGEVVETDRVVCATGFEPAFQHPFVDQLAADLNLARGYRGLPVLNDDTLAWETTDGASLPLYASGALALATVGPYAPNIAGAKRAADRITRALRGDEPKPARSPVRAE